MPAESTVRGWYVDDTEDFSAQYARARDIGLDCRADSMMEDVQGGEDVARDRLKFDATRWYLSKMAPKRYGDRVAVDHGAQDSLAALLSEIDGSRVGPEG